MDPTTTQPYTNQLVFRILQCLHGIQTWYPQASGDQILNFMNHFCMDLEAAYKPALPSNLLHTQFKQASNMYARHIANLTIIHYRKRISDCVQQLCFVHPPNHQIHRAINLAVTKGREKWGRKLQYSVISELASICLNHCYHNRRDSQYKDAHKRKFGLTCHVVQYKDYTSPFPADPSDPTKVSVKSYGIYNGSQVRDSFINRHTGPPVRQHPYSLVQTRTKLGSGINTQRDKQPTYFPNNIQTDRTLDPHLKVLGKSPSNNDGPNTYPRMATSHSIASKISTGSNMVVIQNPPADNTSDHDSDVTVMSSPIIRPYSPVNDTVTSVLDDLLDDTVPTRMATLKCTPVSQATPSDLFTPVITPVEATHH